MKKGAFALVFVVSGFQGLLPAQPETSDVSLSYLSSILVEQGEQQEDAVCVFCSIVVNGEVSRDVVTIGGNIIVNGRVGGDTVASGGYVVLGPGAQLGGDLVAIGGSAVVPEGAVVAASVEELPYVYLPGQINVFSTAALAFLSLCLLLGVLGFAALRRRHSEALAAATNANWILTTSAGLGLTACIGVFFYCFPDASWMEQTAHILLCAATGILAWLGFIGLSAAVGSRIPVRGNWALKGLTGSLILGLSMVIPVVGFAALILVFVVSMGSAAVGFWRSSTFRQFLFRANASRS